MGILVTDGGFAPDDIAALFHPLPANDGARAIDLASDTDPDDLTRCLNGAQVVRINFPSFSDGRGFTLARKLRLLGYRGRLRARGHVIADQYAMARRVGFDEVEISEELAARQPEQQWLARANWKDHDYQSRLRAAARPSTPDAAD